MPAARLEPRRPGIATDPRDALAGAAFEPAEPQAISTGLSWTLGSQVGLQAIRIVVGLVLVRLLTPEQYGVAGMVLVFATLAYVFSDLSLGAALVQRRVLSEIDISTAFWTTAAVGLAFTVVGVAAAPVVAAFYRTPAVEPLFAALSLGFFVGALATTQASLLVRAMDFRSLQLRLLIANLLGAAVALAVARAGGGPWAIIGQELAVGVTSTLLLWRFSRWRPRLAYSLASLRDLAGFGGNVFGSKVLTYLNQNTDNLLVGRFVGAGGLGAYSVAFNTMLIPLSRLVMPIQLVFAPVFARLQDEPQRLADAWVRATRMVAAVALPAFAGLAIVASDFVPVVFGSRWQAATPVMRVLAAVGALQALGSLQPDVLQAADRTGTLLRVSLVSGLATVGSFVVGLRWGIVGVAAAYALATLALQVLWTVVTARTIRTSPWRVASGLAGVVEAVLAMSVVCIALSLLLDRLSLPAAARLPLLIGAGIAVYLPACWWRVPETRDTLRRSARALTRRPRVAGREPTE